MDGGRWMVDGDGESGGRGHGGDAHVAKKRGEGATKGRESKGRARGRVAYER